MPVKRKTLDKPSIQVKNEFEEDIRIAADKNPYVFISHDTRDADLAEEFSNLLKMASAGALKSFRSSDKKGTQGIEYGQEWYPAIMAKIHEATDVVCLLTQHSVDRPWILYEAGVAKGKLDTKVIGIAIGISLSVAVTGPFAQFQNNDGDVASVTNLVIALVRKVPGLDPDHELVTTLVEKFVNKSQEIVKGFEKENSKPETLDENSTAKLFEEVKLMFDALPSRIESRVDPEFRRRRRKYHPDFFEEIMFFGMESKEPLVGFLIAISSVKDDFPWLYEIGLETYRGLKSFKTVSHKSKLIKSFESAIDFAGHPLMREFNLKNDDSYYLLKDFRQIIRRYIDRYINHDIGKAESEQE